MARCPHLRREDAEDMASGALLEILQKNEAVCCIQNWIWTAKMRAFWHYHTIHERFEPQGLLLDFPSTICFSEPFQVETFQLHSLLKRKDARRCFSLWLQGYNRAEIHKILGCCKGAVTTMVYRLRKRAKQYLKRDVELYCGYKHAWPCLHFQKIITTFAPVHYIARCLTGRSSQDISVTVICSGPSYP